MRKIVLNLIIILLIFVNYNIYAQILKNKYPVFQKECFLSTNPSDCIKQKINNFISENELSEEDIKFLSMIIFPTDLDKKVENKQQYSIESIKQKIDSEILTRKKKFLSVFNSKTKTTIIYGVITSKNSFISEQNGKKRVLTKLVISSLSKDDYGEEYEIFMTGGKVYDDTGNLIAEESSSVQFYPQLNRAYLFILSDKYPYIINNGHILIGGRFGALPEYPDKLLKKYKLFNIDDYIISNYSSMFDTVRKTLLK